jgi:hypothetical protein
VVLAAEPEAPDADRHLRGLVDADEGEAGQLAHGLHELPVDARAVEGRVGEEREDPPGRRAQ